MKSSLTVALYRVAGIFALMWVTAAYAQSYTFDIPSKPVAQAIPEFARQAGIQIIAPADGLGSVRTPAIEGSYELHAALSTLLAGTGVTIAADNGRTVVLANETQSREAEPAAPGKPPQLALAQASAAVVQPAAAVVAQNPPMASGAGMAAPEQVVVTGSLLGAANFAAPTPVTQVSGVQIQSLALTGVGSVVEQLPFAQTGAGLTRNTTGGQRAAQSFPNLRGLGPNNTLVLIDGMRPTPVDPTNNFDTDEIPQSLLDRFEVVTTGASATYGSDAVAGVVNFILKDHLEGLTTDARFGVSQRGDTDQAFVSAAWGTTLLNGRGHFVIGGEFANEFNSVYMYARPWGRKEPGIVSLPVATAKALGLPSNLLTHNAEVDNGTFGGLITSCLKGAATVACPAGLRNIQFGADGTPTPFAFGPIAGASFMVGTTNYGASSQNRYLSPPYKRAAGLARFEYDIAPNITAFAMINYGYLDSNLTSLSSPFPSILNVLSGNQFIPASIQAAMAANGITAVQLGKQDWNGRDVGSIAQNKNTLAQSFFGVKGSLFNDWNWDVEGSAGRANVWQENANRLAAANLDLAMNKCQPLTSNSQVALTNSNNGTVTTAAQVNALATPGCVPYNPFGVPSAASINYITNVPGGPSGFEDNLRQYMGQADVSGPVFNLPAGPVDLAIGGNYRYDSVDQRANVAAAEGLFGTPTPSFFQNQSVWEAYSEAGVPIVRDLPFAEAIDLNGAGRYTDYSISGPVWTWKYGGTWDVTDWLRLRATRSQDIRAPNFTELSILSTGGGANVQNPIDGISQRISTQTSGNPNLRPEVSQNVSAGFVLQPTSAMGTLLSGFRASFDYYKIRISGQVASLGSQDVINRCLLQKIAEYCDQVQFAPGFNENSFTSTSTTFGIAGLNLRNVNLNSTYEDGFDINISQRLPLDSSGIPGALVFSALGSYVDQLSVFTNVVNSNGQTVVTRINYADSWFAPRWGWNVNWTYLLDRFTANVQMRYYSPIRYLNISGTGLSGPTGSFNIGPDDQNYTAALAAASSLTINRSIWAAAITWNLALTYDVIQNPNGEDLQVYLNIDNLLDKDPPAIWFYTSTYDVVGRYFRFGIRYTLP